MLIIQEKTEEKKDIYSFYGILPLNESKIEDLKAFRKKITEIPKGQSSKYYKLIGKKETENMSNIYKNESIYIDETRKESKHVMRKSLKNGTQLEFSYRHTCPVSLDVLHTVVDDKEHEINLGRIFVPTINSNSKLTQQMDINLPTLFMLISIYKMWDVTPFKSRIEKELMESMYPDKMILDKIWKYIKLEKIMSIESSQFNEPEVQEYIECCETDISEYERMGYDIIGIGNSKVLKYLK